MPNLRGASPVGRGEGGRRARQRCGHRGESARERGGANGAERGEDTSSRAGRSRKAVDDVLGRLGLSGAGSGRPGPLWTGLGCPGPVWTPWSRFGRSEPVPVWLDGPGVLDRSEPGRSGPAGTGLSLGKGWAGLAGAAGAVPPGHGRSGSDRVDSAGRVE